MDDKNLLYKKYLDPINMLQCLIRFNTSNPPGDEEECVKYIQEVLKSAGIESKIFSKEPKRANLIARIKGSGSKAPLLLYGHLDVVQANSDKWKYPPFDAVNAEDCIWGRGAVDMKGGVSMMLSSILRLKEEGIVPPGDIILCLLSDEEVGNLGAKYMVEEHSEEFKDVKYAIGEFGGFTMYISGKPFYPIMISEKQICSLKATFSGKGGHGSIPVKKEAMAKLGNFLSIINEKKLPVHITEPAKQMVEAMAKNLPLPQGVIIKQLLNKNMTDKVLKLMGQNGQLFEPLFHNTINATMISGGCQINVVPDEVTVKLDGRMLPGFEPEEFLKEIKEISNDAKISIITYDKGPSTIDMNMFKLLGDIIKEEEPEGIPMPILMSGVTDARFFAKLNIQTYGFTPMKFDKDIDFSSMMHAANERIPIKALQFGTQAMYKLLKRF